MFTLTDKTLLDRAARMINGQARGLRVLHEANGWASTEAGRKAKQEYDRLLRDERDMRSLGKRLCAHFDVHAVRGGVVMEAAPFNGVTSTQLRDPTSTVPQDTAEVGDPLNPLSPEARADYLSELGPGSNRDFSGVKLDANPGSGTSQVPDAQANGENVPRVESAGNPESTPAADGGKVESLQVMCPLCGPVLKPCNMQECRVLDAFHAMPAPVGNEVHDG